MCVSICSVTVLNIPLAAAVQELLAFQLPNNMQKKKKKSFLEPACYVPRVGDAYVM